LQSALCDIQGSDKGVVVGAMPRGGTFLGGGTFGEKNVSKWSFTDEPEVRFRFRF